VISKDIQDGARQNTIFAALKRSAARNGKSHALSFSDRHWSYADLIRGAENIATHLVELGFKSGDRIAAYGRNSDAYLLLWLACCRAGLVHVPINYSLIGNELRYIVEQSGATALFHDEGLGTVADLKNDPGTVRHFGTFTKGGSGRDILSIARAEDRKNAVQDVFQQDDLVQLLYTSGTTAAPKGAMMTNAAFLAEYVSCIVDLEMSRNDKSLVALPLYHSAAMHAFLMPSLLVGSSNILIEAPSPELCLQLIEEHQITSLFAPPTVWISFLRHPDFAKRNLSSLRNIYYGASIMPVPVLQELRERLPGARPFNAYGQSEIGPLATVLRPEEHDERPASAGRPVFNVESRIVDENMQDVPPGTQGEIVHRSPQLLVGYWNLPEETEAAFAGGWFHSGDVGVRDEEGFITVVDRLKDIIKTGGVIVASREVEEAIFTHPCVSEVAVIALPDPKWIEAVTAVVTLRSGQSVDEESLIAYARSKLAPFKVPKRIFFVDVLPRNTAGKLLKRELRLKYTE
jgi:fatty-acyl-CoA synthase